MERWVCESTCKSSGGLPLELLQNWSKNSTRVMKFTPIGEDF